jgi:NDP-sugar pyrophosphorylase family protein
MQAVILAGGLGTRLRPLTDSTPKPMIRIHGKPFAEYLVQLLRDNGVDRIVFLTGYLGEQFPAYFGDGSRWGVSITYSHSAVENDTGTRLRIAAPLLDEEFLLVYGDNYWPLSLPVLARHHADMGTMATVTVFERPNTGGNNKVRVENGLVTRYDRSGADPSCNGIDIGFFIMRRAVLDLLPEGNVHFEKTVFPPLIERGELAGFLTQEPYVSLTSPDRLPQVEQVLQGRPEFNIEVHRKYIKSNVLPVWHRSEKALGSESNGIGI